MLNSLLREAAIGLGLVVAELSHPAFRNRAITFESSPQWVHLDGAGKVASKVRALQGASWGGSTDFEAACGVNVRPLMAAWAMTKDDLSTALTMATQHDQ